MKDKRPLKVLHIMNGLGFGGAETWLLEIVKLNKGVHQFDFFLTGGQERELDAAFVENGCRLYYCKFSRKDIFLFVKCLRKLMHSNRYDVIHDHEDFVAGWHWLFMMGQWPKMRIAHAHNSTIYIENYLMSGKRNFFYKVGKYLTRRLSTKISGTSNQLMNEIGYNRTGFLNKRIEPLYCGIEPDLFMYNEQRRSSVRSKLGIKNEDKVVIFIGRIGLVDSIYENPKNPMFAFELAKSICKQDVSTKFLFVGHKGDLGLRLESVVSSEGLSDKILFLGNRNDIPDLLSASDVMLFTATTEPFGLILIEAQFNGLPIVASDAMTEEAAQFPELITLLSLDKGVTEWCKAISQILTGNHNRQSFTTQNKHRIFQSKFSIEQSFQRLHHHYIS